MKDLVPDRYAVTMRLYPYARSPDQDAGAPMRHKVVVIGGGPPCHGAGPWATGCAGRGAG
jgi:hypothetical protein